MRIRVRRVQISGHDLWQVWQAHGLRGCCLQGHTLTVRPGGSRRRVETESVRHTLKLGADVGGRRFVTTEECAIVEKFVLVLREDEVVALIADTGRLQREMR